MYSDYIKASDIPVLKTLSPPKEAEIPVGPLKRLEIEESFEHYLQTGRNLNKKKVLARIAFEFLAAAGLGVAVYFVLPFFAGTEVAHITAIGAAVLTAIFSVVVLLWADGVLRNNWSNSSPLKNGALKMDYNKNYAPHWAEAAARALRHSAQSKIVDPIRSFKDDLETPYRILTGFAPVPIWSMRRPDYTKAELLESERQGWKKKRLINIDAMCGALLELLDSRPEPRFTDGGTDDDPVVQSFHWQYGVQQMPDSIQNDIFLRFCQSTIERNYRSACRYKTYATLNNFRGVPLILLRVKDIVNCLSNDTGEHSDHHDIIFDNLSLVNPENIIETLKAPAYYRYPPRMERIIYDDTDPTPGAILFNQEDDDWTMLFDPARVWAQDGTEKQKYLESIVALRRAIHIVSREHAVVVTLKKRDVLLVDNLRVLVGRWEDRPAKFPWRDVVAAFNPSLEGRWLRLTYGFPQARREAASASRGAVNVSAGLGDEDDTVIDEMSYPEAPLSADHAEGLDETM